MTSLSLLCIGEGNGNPLQCSCLENPRTGEPDGLPSMGSQSVGREVKLPAQGTMRAGERQGKKSYDDSALDA